MQDAGCRMQDAGCRMQDAGPHRPADRVEAATGWLLQQHNPPCRGAECRVASLSPATAGRKRKPQTPEEELRDEYDRAV